MLRAGMLIFHALARRLRDFDFEVFFLGTATVLQYYTLPATPPAQDVGGDKGPTSHHPRPRLHRP
jgi:hypothetical protein